MRTKILLLTILLLAIITLVALGCEEVQQKPPQPSPVERLSEPTPSWMETYSMGDPEISRITYNTLLLYYIMQRGDAKLEKEISDPNDPNSIDNRLKRLESFKLTDPNDPTSDILGEASLTIIDPNEGEQNAE